MSKIRLLVVGAGGHDRFVVEAAELLGRFEEVSLLDDSLPASDRVMGVTMLGRAAWMQARAALGYGLRVTSGEVLILGAARESK